MTCAVWAISDNEHLAVLWRCRGCNDQWMNSSNVLDGFLLPVGICSPVWFSAWSLLHMSKASSRYWFLKLVPFGTSCTSADSCKQTKHFWRFMEVSKESPIPQCLHFENKNTAVFPPTWTLTDFTFSGADRGFLHVIPGAGCLSKCFSPLLDSVPVLK